MTIRYSGRIDLSRKFIPTPLPPKRSVSSNRVITILEKADQELDILDPNRTARLLDTHHWIKHRSRTIPDDSFERAVTLPD